MRKSRQGRADSSGLASLNNFGGLWALRVGSRCLVPGSGMVKAEKYCLLGPHRRELAPDWKSKSCSHLGLLLSLRIGELLEEQSPELGGFLRSQNIMIYRK